MNEKLLDDEDHAKQCINAYRSGYPGVPSAWRGVENHFKQVMLTGEPQEFNGLRFRGEKIASENAVVMTLPSGRDIFYYDPNLRPGKWGSELWFKIKYQNSMVHRKSWGGDVFQDAVQGTARDLCVFGTKEVERRGFEPIMSVHDEVVAIGDKDADIREFEKGFEVVPAWGSEIPVSAEGWSGKIL